MRNVRGAFNLRQFVRNAGSMAVCRLICSGTPVQSRVDRDYHPSSTMESSATAGSDRGRKHAQRVGESLPQRRVAELTVSVRFAPRLQQSTGWSFGRDRFKRKRNEGRNPRCERQCGTQAALTRGGPGWASGSVKSVVFIGVGDRASAAAHIAFLNRKGPALLMPHPGDQAAPLCSYASLMLL
jgi:hypothetical protein